MAVYIEMNYDLNDEIKDSRLHAFSPSKDGEVHQNMRAMCHSVSLHCAGYLFLYDGGIANTPDRLLWGKEEFAPRTRSLSSGIKCSCQPKTTLSVFFWRNFASLSKVQTTLHR